MMTTIIAALTAPGVLVAILGIIGTLLGWYVKRWWMNFDDKEKTEQRQKSESELADQVTKKWADESAKMAAAKEKSDKAAADWLKKP